MPGIVVDLAPHFFLHSEKMQAVLTVMGVVDSPVLLVGIRAGIEWGTCLVIDVESVAVFSLGNWLQCEPAGCKNNKLYSLQWLPSRRAPLPECLHLQLWS